MRKGFIALVFLAFCTTLVAQQAMDNVSIIKLVKAGLSDDLIVNTINASPAAYDTSANGLIALKTAGASDRVVSAIVLKATGGTPSSTASAAPVGQASVNPDDPNSPHEAGIYVYSDTAPAGSKMNMLEPSIYTQAKTGGTFTSAITVGIAKIKTKAVLRGAHANARVSDPQVVFYFYFEEQGAGLSHASTPFGGTSTPNEYTLLKFDIKGDTRETIIAKANVFGASGGTDDKAVTPFTYTKLRPGVYKVTLNGPLQPGEYGFISEAGPGTVSPNGGVATSDTRVFDFGRN
jgi:hypothetical protein